eukprot:c23162_g1_i1 orf=266-1927(+)
MKTTKGGKVMNPTDAYRKELRKKELKRNKKERKKVREVGILKKDPEAIREQIRKLEMMKADGALDKTRRHKKRQLEDTLNLVLKKRKEYEEKMREKGEEPIMFSHLPVPRRRATADEEQRSKHPKPEDSVYFHPTLNPTGAPPPGKPPMYKSSVGPRIPLSTGAAASNEEPEVETSTLPLPPPPPPPPPPALKEGASATGEQSVPLQVPVPPPPPALSHHPFPTPVVQPPPPPPPGPPPKLGSRQPPLPPLPRLPQPPPPGTGTDMSGSKTLGTDDENIVKEKAASTSQASQDWGSQGLPPPPPPPRSLPQSGPQETREDTDHETSRDANLQQRPPPPPTRLPAPTQPTSTMLRTPPGHPSQNHPGEVLPPGVSRLPPPPPPPGMRPPLPGPPPPPPRVPPPVVGPPGAPPARTHLGHPPGPPMLIPPVPPSGQQPGLSSLPQKQDGSLPSEDPGKKPSYIKSAAATVVKRPLAQHTPELTAMVPASVRVRRESIQKPKPKPFVAVNVTTSGVTRMTPTQPVPKPQSIDDSYLAFLEDMKALGAFDDEAMNTL